MQRFLRFGFILENIAIGRTSEEISSIDTSSPGGGRSLGRGRLEAFRAEEGGLQEAVVGRSGIMVGGRIGKIEEGEIGGGAAGDEAIPVDCAGGGGAAVEKRRRRSFGVGREGARARARAGGFHLLWRRKMNGWFSREN